MKLLQYLNLEKLDLICFEIVVIRFKRLVL